MSLVPPFNGCRSFNLWHWWPPLTRPSAALTEFSPEIENLHHSIIIIIIVVVYFVLCLSDLVGRPRNVFSYLSILRLTESEKPLEYTRSLNVSLEII